jgi:hypothetical protein
MTIGTARSILLLSLLSLSAAQCDPPILSLAVEHEQVLALEIGPNHITSWRMSTMPGAPALVDTQHFSIPKGETFTVDVVEAAGIYVTTSTYATTPTYQVHFRGQASNMVAFSYVDFEDQSFSALRNDNNPLPLSAHHGDMVDLMVPLNYAIERWQRLPNSLSSRHHDDVLAHYTTWLGQNICTMDLPPALLSICDEDSEEAWTKQKKQHLRELWQSARPKHAKLLPTGDIEHVLTPMDYEIADWLGACYEQSRWDLANDRTYEEDQALVEKLLTCLYGRIKSDWSKDEDAEYLIDPLPIGAEVDPAALVLDWRQPATDVQDVIDSVVGAKMFLYSAPSTDESPCSNSAINITIDIQGVALVIGTPLNDHIIGGNRSNDVEILLGGSGQDCIEGRRGDEIILGGSGSDIILGGAHQELIVGDNGDDKISAGRGTVQDHLHAGSILFGDEGKDKIQGSKPSLGVRSTGFSDVINVEDGVDGRGGADLVIGLNSETDVQDLNEQVDLSELLDALDGDGMPAAPSDEDITDAFGEPVASGEAGSMKGLPGGGSGGGDVVIQANANGGSGGAQFVEMPSGGGGGAMQNVDQAGSDSASGGAAPGLKFKITEKEGEAGEATVVIPVIKSKNNMADALSLGVVMPPVDGADKNSKPTNIELITGAVAVNKFLFPEQSAELEDEEEISVWASSPKSILFIGLFILWWLQRVHTALRQRRVRHQSRRHDAALFNIRDDE